MWIAVACVVAGAWAVPAGKREAGGVCCPLVASMTATAGETDLSGTNATTKAKLPRLVDLGAGKCIPCKKMAPILEKLKKEYAGRMEVEFIDVWKEPDAGKPYGIRLIPTQIFYDAAGKELYRHEGFISEEDILAKWKDLGVTLKSEGRNPKAGGTAAAGSNSSQPSASKPERPAGGEGR
jgi:thioredoxin 1